MSSAPPPPAATKGKRRHEGAGGSSSSSSSSSKASDDKADSAGPKEPRLTPNPQSLAIGHAGGEALLVALSQEDPRQAIPHFQQRNGLDPTIFPSCIPVLELLDLHDVERAEAYAGILGALREKLVERIKTMDKPGLSALINSSFPFVSFDELRAVPLAAIEQLGDDVPHPLLRRLAALPEVYRECSLEVKRLIWLADSGRFRDEVFPLFNQYINDTELHTAANEMLIVPAVPPSRRRQNSALLQQLVGCVGRRVPLYQSMVVSCHTLFANSGRLAFCTLRAELLMAIHDANISEISGKDPCHGFAWYLDACVRDGTVEPRRVSEMQNSLTALEEGNPTYGDLAMILSDPYAFHTLLRSAFLTVVSLVTHERIPKEDPTLQSLTRLLLLAAHSRAMLQTQRFAVPRGRQLEKEMLEEYYPILAGLLLDDILTKGQPRQALEIPAQLSKLFVRNPLARKLTLFYLLTRIEAGDVTATRSLLAFVAATLADGHTATPAAATTAAAAAAAAVPPPTTLEALLGDEPAFVQSAVSLCVASWSWGRQQTAAAIRTAVLDDCLLPLADVSPVVHTQLLRFASESHLRLPPPQLAALVQRLLPPQTTTTAAAATAATPKINYDKMRPGFEALFERIKARVSARMLPQLYQMLGKEGAAAAPSSTTTTSTSTSSSSSSADQG